MQMRNQEIQRKSRQQDEQEDMDMTDQQQYKRNMSYLMVSINIVFHGLGSVLLISYFFRTFVSYQQNEKEEQEYLLKTDYELMKFKFNEIFYIAYLHASCIGATYFLGIFQESFKERRIEQTKDQKTSSLLLIQQNDGLIKYIFNYTLLSMFLINAICSAWKISSPLSMKRLIYLVYIELICYVFNSIAQLCSRQSMIHQLRYLIISLAISTHLIIILHNYKIPNPLLI